MYILASQSPRRNELLSQIIREFKVIPSNINENIKVNTPEELPLMLSKLKAEEIFKTHQDDTIIAADTIVVLDKKILGKPKNEKEAYKMLTSLSNKKHEVITGYTILSKEKCISRAIKTEVYFNKLNEQTIKEYIKTGSPFDKAGGYGIQDKEFNLVKKIKGSLSNVIGLPLESLANDIL